MKAVISDPGMLTIGESRRNRRRERIHLCEPWNAKVEEGKSNALGSKAVARLLATSIVGTPPAPMAGARPATTMNESLSRHRSIVVAGLAPAMGAGGPCNSPALGSRLDVLIHTEEIGRIVLALDGCQALVVVAI